MSFSSIGDLSRTLTLRHANTGTKAALIAHSREVTTGIKADIPAALGGDTLRLADIESRIATLDAYRQSANEIGARAESMQIALGGVQTLIKPLSAELLKVGTTPSPGALTAVTTQGKGQLNDAIITLNAQIGGQYLFGGTRVSAPPLANAETLLTALREVTDGLTSTEDILAAVGEFFDAPAGADGFIDKIYRGAETPARTAIAPDRSADLPAHAASDAIRETLKGLAILALSSESPYADNAVTQAHMVSAAGTTLMNADIGLTHMRGEIGTAEAAIGLAQTRNAAEDAAFKLSRNAMITVDPYEAASSLREAEARMEAVYALTARLSRLSLAGYL